MNPTPFLGLALLALPLISPAQSAPSPDSLRRRGELTGARPASPRPARSRTPARLPTAPAATAPSASADPVQQHLLASEVNLARTGASQLPDLYERFIATTRDERRQWSYTDWDAAGQVLARLNQRYEQVRTELPLDERLRIRSFQGEFHALRGARQVKDKMDN